MFQKIIMSLIVIGWMTGCAIRGNSVCRDSTQWVKVDCHRVRGQSETCEMFGNDGEKSVKLFNLLKGYMNWERLRYSRQFALWNVNIHLYTNMSFRITEACLKRQWVDEIFRKEEQCVYEIKIRQCLSQSDTLDFDN